MINKGKRIAILAGQGAFHASDELIQLAEVLGAPIVKPLLGKGCVPDDSPYTTGGIGLLGTAPSEEVMENCDTLIMVGTSYPYIGYHPKPGDCKCMQIDSNAQRIGLRMTLRSGWSATQEDDEDVAASAEANGYRRFLDSAQKSMKDWNEVIEKEGTNQRRR